MIAGRLRLLLAEKRLTEAGIILRSVCAETGWALEWIYAETVEDIRDKLKEHNPDLALLDLSLLQPDPAIQVGLLSIANPAVPLFLFAEPGEKSRAVECLSTGARDFLLEGFLDERTVERVLREVIGNTDAKWPQGAAESMSAGQRNWGSDEEMAERRGVPLRCRAEGCVPLEMLQKLKRNIRSGDVVVPRRCGQIDLVLAQGTAKSTKAVEERLKGQLCSHVSMGSMSNVVRVRLERGTTGTPAILSEAGACEFGNEDCEVK